MLEQRTLRDPTSRAMSPVVMAAGLWRPASVMAAATIRA
jgi:hypothetical protein